jgi:hypothetical protein
MFYDHTHEVLKLDRYPQGVNCCVQAKEDRRELASWSGVALEVVIAFDPECRESAEEMIP